MIEHMTENNGSNTAHPDRRFPTWGDLGVLLGIALGAQIAVGIVAAAIALALGVDLQHLEPRMQGRYLAATYFISMSLALAGVLLYRYSRGGRGAVADCSTRRLDPVLLGWCCLLLFATNVVCEPLLDLLPKPADQVGRGFWTFLSLVVFAPVFEELLCRGVVLGALRAKYGVVRAWLLSSLFFGVLHVQPLLAVNACIIGLILGFVYMATGSIWAPMLLHAVNNGAAYLQLEAGLGDTSLREMLGGGAGYVAVYAAALVVLALSVAAIRRSLSRLDRAEKNRTAA